MIDCKCVLIMGYGRSGKSAQMLLEKLNISYKVYDKKVPDVDYNKLNKKIISNFDLIVLSPGISIYNKYVTIAKKLGIEVISELELGYRVLENPLICVTGTNGKTTTTKLIDHIISTKFASSTYGNIGTPLTSAYGLNYDYIVCEVSSFQLECVRDFKPKISVLLNLAEDHLDRHRTFENYVNCKLAMLKNNNEQSITIINGDDNLLVSKCENIKGQKYYFSKYDEVNGVYIKDGIICSNIYGSEESIVASNLIVDLSSSTENVLASILVSLLLGIEKDEILKSLKSFKSSSHRLETVLEKNNIKYINDSKSTNIHSTIHAIEETRGEIILLLGGKNKNLSFDNIFNEYLHNLKSVVAFGAARKEILKSAKKYNFENVLVSKKFKDAVKLACSIAKENSSVLLSPACTSLDEFNSYTERGDEFTKLVKEYNNVKG